MIDFFIALFGIPAMIGIVARDKARSKAWESNFERWANERREFDKWCDENIILDDNTERLEKRKCLFFIDEVDNMVSELNDEMLFAYGDRYKELYKKKTRYGEYTYTNEAYWIFILYMAKKYGKIPKQVRNFGLNTDINDQSRIKLAYLIEYYMKRKYPVFCFWHEPEIDHKYDMSIRPEKLQLRLKQRILPEYQSDQRCNPWIYMKK